VLPADRQTLILAPFHIAFGSVRALLQNSQYYSSISTPVPPGAKLPPVVIQVPAASSTAAMQLVHVLHRLQPCACVTQVFIFFKEPPLYRHMPVTQHSLPPGARLLLVAG
jgi:hypothetical protein